MNGNNEPGYLWSMTSGMRVRTPWICSHGSAKPKCPGLSLSTQVSIILGHMIRCP